VSRDDRHQAAKVRVRRALHNIQAAQNHLGRAASDLGAVCYGGPKQREVMRLYDRVHALWYRVNTLETNQRIELDREPEARDLDERPGVES